jgi:hypothetical protein
VLVLGDCDEGDPSYGFCSDLTRAVAVEDGGAVRKPRLVPVDQLARG